MRDNRSASSRLIVGRRTLVLSALAVAGCAGTPAPHEYPPLNFSYLLPLRLNVGAIEIVDRFVASGLPPDVSGFAPVQPVAALELMAQQRLKAVGTSGQAVFVIDDASLVRHGDTVTGTMRVELDITEGGDVPAGYAQATVVQAYSGDLTDLPTVLYRLVRKMMARMNVEFEFQVRRSLGKWLVPESAVPPPVHAAPLQPAVPGQMGVPPPPRS